MSGIWMYVLGEIRSADWKIGHTRGPIIGDRVKTVNGQQTADESYVLLAGVRASTKDEEAVKEYFSAHLRPNKGKRTEYFLCADECVESPLWAFTTHLARPLMERASATLVFTPTPSFWCALDSANQPCDWKGSNHPHAVVYFGERRREFLGAFAHFGLPFNFAWSEIPVAEVAA